MAWLRSLARCALAAVCFVAARAAEAQPAPLPSAGSRPWSVVLITVDALRADRMHLYGNPRPTTPQLDAFAREAAVFERFFAVAAHTSPGIVSLLTGQEPPVHAQTTQYSFHDAAIPTPLSLLAGQGWDVVGHTVRGPTYEGLGFGRGSEGESEEALLDALAAPRPFFVWLHTRETHLPYRPAPEVAGRFTRGLALDSPLLRAVQRFVFVLRHPPADFPYPHAGAVTPTPADGEPLRALYDECVASADARVGAWLARLRASGALERTIVVVTADHGDELLDDGWVGHASTGYDGKLVDAVLHVPLIVRFPGGAWAGRYRALASQVDVMPTVLEALGVDASALAENVQGRSLAPILRGERRSVRDSVFAETTHKGWTTPRAETRDRVAAVRVHGRWRPVPPAVSAAQRAAAARQAYAAADAHLAQAEAALARGDAAGVVAQWQAIARLHATYGYERDPFWVGDAGWNARRERIADLAARALRCDARGLALDGPECAQGAL